jgi:nucleoside-diphosphate-sugar epimerase
VRFTVFGARGFIGARMADYLRGRGHEVLAPSRGAEETAGADLGHVIYAIGLTGDFRARPFETIDAHVSTLARLMRDARYDSWLYLSSTRLYGAGAQRAPCRETDAIGVTPGPDSLYDASKLLGEALCLTQPRARAVRLSNVYAPNLGPETFLGAVLDELRRAGEATLREAPGSAKDYVSLAAICPLLEAIATRGTQRLYNVASGRNVSHAEIAALITRATGCRVSFAEGAPERAFPSIDVSRAAAEFSFSAPSLADDLETLLIESGVPSRGARANP